MLYDRTLLVTVIAVLATLVGCSRGSPDAVAEHFVPAKPDAIGPRLTGNIEGDPILSWMEPDPAGHTLWFSILADDGWETPRAVVSGRDMFANWADLPSVLRVSADHWAAHWLEMAGDSTYAYHVAIAQSFNGGHTWSQPVIPHSDVSPTEHGFVSFFQSAKGLSAVWLDGRNTGSASDDDSLLPGMTLRTATLDPDGNVYDEVEIDDLVCDCCQTDAAVTENGPLVLYRDRATNEIRDIHVAQKTPAGWEAGRPLHDDGWKIGGCPVNGPAVDASASRVAAAWFTAAFKRPRVQLKFSDDGGTTFGDEIAVASTGTLGHVDTVLLQDGTAVVSWLETEGGPARLRVRRFGDSVWSYGITVADDVEPRSVPQMVLHDDRILLVWTARQGESRRIRSASLSIDALAVK